MPPLPCSPLPSKLMFLSLFALSINFPIYLPPSQPRLLHRSFLLCCCFHLHYVPQHWKCCSWRNLKQLSEEQQLAPPPYLLLIYSQIPPKPKRDGGQGKGTGVAVVMCPQKCQDLGRRRVSVPVVPPGKPGRWQEEAINTCENGGSLRAALVTWSFSPVPGLKRILGGHKVQLGPGAIPS